MTYYINIGSKGQMLWPSYSVARCPSYPEKWSITKGISNWLAMPVQLSMQAISTMRQQLETVMRKWFSIV